MSYFFLEDMRFGVDLRKANITAPPGTLREAINCHLTRGAEPEKRKAFVTQADLPAGTHGLLAIGETAYVFGSEDLAASFPINGVTYQRLEYNSKRMLQVVVAENFNGKPFVGARFEGYGVVYFYDGKQVVGLDVANDAAALDMVPTAKAKLEASLAPVGYSVTSDGTKITLQAPKTFKVDTMAYTFDPSYADADKPVVTEVQPYRPHMAGRAPSFRITIRNQGFIVLHSLKVNNTELFTMQGDYDGAPSARLGWVDNSSQTAALVAANINLLTASHGWTATATTNYIEVVLNTETDSLNDVLPVLTYGGQRLIWDDSVTSLKMTQVGNGLTPVSEQDQITEVVILKDTAARTNERVNSITVSSDEVEASISVSPCPDHEEGKFYAAQPLVSKMFIIDGTLVRFSKVNDAGKWNKDGDNNDVDNGSGFFNAASDMRQSKFLTGIGNYQGKLAVFGEQDTKLYAVDVDPNNDQVIQKIQNIGSVAPQSILDIGDLDTYFLDVSGVRQLQAKDSSNIASKTDVGSPIDPLVQGDLEALPPYLYANAISLQDPRTGRYWCAIGERVYVYSNFPEAKVSAWTWYEPGFLVSAATTQVGSILTRSGDRVHIYGGKNNRVYDKCPVSLLTPFMPAGKEATRKNITSYDVAVEGRWSFELRTDPNAPEAGTDMGTVDRITYSEATLPLYGETTHFAVKLTNEGEGPAKFMNMAVHFRYGDEQ